MVTEYINTLDQKKPFKSVPLSVSKFSAKSWVVNFEHVSLPALFLSKFEHLNAGWKWFYFIKQNLRDTFIINDNIFAWTSSIFVNTFQQKLVSCRIQPIDLQNKSIDWFLYDTSFY